MGSLRTSRSQQSARKPRVYRQEARARQAEANAAAILRATVARLLSAPVIADITLDDIARDAGLTVRTVLRRFSSRDGVFEAAYGWLRPQMEAARRDTPPGDVDAAVASLVDQYEQMGDFNIRALEQEHALPLLGRALGEARTYHRRWLGRAFAPNLAHLPPPERARRVTALYAATDVYLWKLLRRDLHEGRGAAEDVFRRLVRGVLAPTSPRSKGGS
jgi:AcrR family transcriptional regulator